MEFITDLFEYMIANLTTIITGVATAVKDGFVNLMFESTVTEGVTTLTGPSTLGYFAFGMIGVSLALGLGYTILRIARIGNR